MSRSRSRNRARAWPVSALAISAVLLAGGCGGAPSGEAGHEHASGTHVMPDGSTMSDAEMEGMGHDHGDHGDGGMGDMQADDGPSEAAAMICTDETRAAVQRTFGLDEKPVPLDSWADQTYRCTYQLTGGDLRVQVKDLDEADAGRAWFDGLRQRLPGATPIKGMQSLGFPAFETPHGDVAFLKDHKTLWVDASRLRSGDLPSGLTRTEGAYGVAAAVLACWTE